MDAHRHGDDVMRVLSLIRKRNSVKNAGELCTYYCLVWKASHSHSTLTICVGLSPTLCFMHCWRLEGPEKSSVQIVLWKEEISFVDSEGACVLVCGPLYHRVWENVMSLWRRRKLLGLATRDWSYVCCRLTNTVALAKVNFAPLCKRLERAYEQGGSGEDLHSLDLALW